MLLEGLVLMTGAEVGKHLLKSATEVGGGAIKEYLKGFFKGKLGDIVDKFQSELKAAMEKAIGEFMKLFVEELRNSGVTEKSIDRYYVNSESIESFIKDKDTIAILGEAFDASREGFDRHAQTRIKRIWIERYLISGVTFPVDFDWLLLLYKYQLKVNEIRRADEKLRKILDSELLGSIDNVAKKSYEIQKSNAPIPIGFDLDGYRQSLQYSYGHLKLGRLNSKDKHDIQLCKIFIEQNVREDLPPDRSPNPNSDELTRQYLEKSAEPVLKAIGDKKCQRAVLVGDPGSGKSSLLQYLALDWAEGKTDRFPLLIELREYAIDRSGAKNFLDFLVGGVGADWKFDRHQLHEHLQTQPSLVMFDGLDEIFDPQLRESTIEEIANFATQQYPNAKIVITSRVVGYDPDRLRGVKFQHFTLQELDKSQIQKFIDKWYQLALGEDPQQEQLKQRLKDAIDRSPAIQNLANNPLLLTLMAMLNRQGSLPNQRVDLYDRASRLLLHNWDFEGKNLKLDPSLETIEAEEKQEILGNIAYEMQSEAGLAGNLLGSKRLKQILTGYLKKNDFQEPKEKAQRLIEQLRRRSFILSAYGTDAYGFVHRTFLEYFCARDFVRRLNEESYPSLEQLRDDIFARYWQDETWHEVLQLICGLLKPDRSGYLVEFLMIQEVDRADYLDNEKQATKGAFQHLRLAIECWAEVKSPKSKLTTEKLKEKLKKEIESQSNILLNYDSAKLLLDSIAEYYHKEPQTLNWLHQVAFNDQDKWVRWAAVESIAQYYHKEQETLTWLHQVAFTAQYEDVRSAAVRSIAQYYQKEPEILTWLQQIAFNDQDEDVRQKAVNSIAEYYHKEPQTLTWLQQVAFNDQSSWVRWQAVNSIAEYYHKEPQILTWLQDIALKDRNDGVRQKAVYSIAEYYHTEPETLNCLQQVALNDQSSWVRRAAVYSIAEYYHTEPETLNCLQQVALNDQYEDVRRGAVYSIAKYYHKEPQTLTCLQQVALNAQDNGVRGAAVSSIAEYYHKEPQTLNWLQQVAFNDQDEDVREEAVYSIAVYYHKEPETLTCLQQVALNAQHDRVRWAAVRSIADYYHGVPEILTWLQQVALNDQDKDVRQKAVESIAKYYHTEPGTLNCLKDIVLNAQHEDVRGVAVKSIAKYYHTEPGTLNWLKDIALQDRNDMVRFYAVCSIAEYYIKNDSVFKLLCQVASQDPYRGENDDNPRKIALEAVVENYIDRPEVIELLRDRSTQDPDEELRIWAEEQLNKL
jgi:HEAT repeat protein